MKIIALSGKAKSGKDTFARISQTVSYTIPVGLADHMKRAVIKTYDFKISDVFGNGKTKEVGYLQHPKAEFAEFKLEEVKNPWSYVCNHLKCDKLFQYTSEEEVRGDSKIFSYPDESHWVNFVAAGHPKFWLSPREAMQNKGSELESESESALTSPLIRDIRLLGEGYSRIAELHELQFGYDRILGVYHWKSESEKSPIIVITDVRKPHQLYHLRQAFPSLISVKIERNINVDVRLHSSESAVDQFEFKDFDFVIHNDGNYEAYSHKVRSLLTNIVR